jgi:hypothetical protein
MASRKRQRPGAPASGRGAHIQALRNRARRPETRPARYGRANRNRAAIQEAS